MERENQEYISIVNATENNLKHVSLKIPEKENHGFTGVSGSGKSSLCLDTIAAESRRELNVTFQALSSNFCRNMVVRRLSAWRIFRSRS